MNINLRYVSQELHQLLKVRAASEGVTLESLCVNYLWLGLDISNGGKAEATGGSSPPAPTKSTGAGPVVGILMSKMVEAVAPLKPYYVPEKYRKAVKK